MNELSLGIDFYKSITIPIVFLFIGVAIMERVLPDTIINLSKVLSAFKGMFYLILAIGIYFIDLSDFLNVTPEILSIGQYITVILAILESLSNFNDYFKMDKKK